MRSRQNSMAQRPSDRRRVVDEGRTFSELGIPFPLFEAPAKLASAYAGKGYCDLCSTDEQHVFSLGIGDEILSKCAGCGSDLAFSASDKESKACSSCDVTSPFPLIKRDDLHACYSCVRTGRATFTQDTEFGMVRYEDARRGLTHGVPDLDANGYDTSLSDDGWTQVSVSADRLMELVRTPGYISWQGERWLFCCGGPMVYVGEWRKADFSRNDKDGDGQALFSEMCAGEEWSDFSWDTLDHDIPGVIYAFRCTTCDRRRAHWDCD